MCYTIECSWFLKLAVPNLADEISFFVWSPIFEAFHETSKQYIDWLFHIFSLLLFSNHLTVHMHNYTSNNDWIEHWSHTLHCMKILQDLITMPFLSISSHHMVVQEIMSSNSLHSKSNACCLPIMEFNKNALHSGIYLNTLHASSILPLWYKNNFWGFWD